VTVGLLKAVRRWERWSIWSISWPWHARSAALSRQRMEAIGY